VDSASGRGCGSLSEREGWTMKSADHGGRRDRETRRQVVVAWAVAAILVGALALTVPSRSGDESVARLWSVAPAAGDMRHKALDAEGPSSDDACSERDYANERC